MPRTRAIRAAMIPAEPIPTAILLTISGLLMVISVLFSRASERFGVPVLLVFLVIGIAAGSEGIGGLPFEDYAFTFRVGMLALVLILFDGGLNTPIATLRRSLRPASVLATVGVAGTALLAALGARLCGFPWDQALLLGAVVSSTDAAAVFAVLRGSNLQVRRRVAATLELESGLNDPMAMILTIAVTRHMLGAEGPGWLMTLAGIVVQMGVGAGLGVALGLGGRYLLSRTQLPAGGLYPVLTLGLALLAFGAPTLFAGSGLLAVYLAAMVLGNGPIPYRAGIRRVHDAIAWFSQVAMFLMLGLLVFPSRLMEVALPGLGIALFLVLVARPAVVMACLAPFRFERREVLFTAWTGLRGAVPIILATYPVMAGAEGALRIFDVVFFVVVVNGLVPGGTIPLVTRWLGLEEPAAPPPPAVLEITSTREIKEELLSVYIHPAVAVCGMPLAEIPFPPGSAVMLVVRGPELIAPRGSTVLQAGDHAYVFCKPQDRMTIELLFGRSEA